MSTAMKDKLVAERLYDRETCDVMSDAEAETLWRLHQEIGQAFDAVCDAYAATLGLENSQLSDEQRADIIDKVEALTETTTGRHRWPISEGDDAVDGVLEAASRPRPGDLEYSRRSHQQVPFEMTAGTRIRAAKATCHRKLNRNSPRYCTPAPMSASILSPTS